MPITPDTEIQKLSEYELELESTDAANRPYIKMRGNLYWNGNAWVKLPALPAPTMSGVHNGTATATSAGTAQIGAIPSSSYELVLCNTSSNDMYWGYDTGVTSSNGILLPKISGTVAIVLPANISVYLYCVSSTSLNYTTRTL